MRRTLTNGSDVNGSDVKSAVSFTPAIGSPREGLSTWFFSIARTGLLSSERMGGHADKWWCYRGGVSSCGTGLLWRHFGSSGNWGLAIFSQPRSETEDNVSVTSPNPIHPPQRFGSPSGSWWLSEVWCWPAKREISRLNCAQALFGITREGAWGHLWLIVRKGFVWRYYHLLKHFRFLEKFNDATPQSLRVMGNVAYVEPLPNAYRQRT